MPDAWSPRFGLGLANKTAVVLGVADESSIAWSIAQAFARRGARVHIGYEQKFFSRVRLLLRDNPEIQGLRCDVMNDGEVAAFFAGIDGSIDALVHSIAFGSPELFTEAPSDVGASAFARSLRISAYSLAGIVRHAKPRLNEWASVVALTFQASERAEPFYGLMGVVKSALESLVRYLALELGRHRVRVNAISPGPVETVAALGIFMALQHDPQTLSRCRSNLVREVLEEARSELGAAADDVAVAQAAFRHFKVAFARKCAIPEEISREDVANCALFLASDCARKITGQVIHVDCGLSSVLLV